MQQLSQNIQRYLNKKPKTLNFKMSKRFERTLHQGGQMANKQVERSLASLIIREMQIKTMKRYQDTLQWLKLRRLTLPSVGVLGSWSGNLKWHNHFETVWLGFFFF